MFNKRLFTYLFLLPLSFMFNCMTSSLTNRNTTFPVLVGPVLKIQGSADDHKKLGIPAGKFDAEVNETFSVVSSKEGNQTVTRTNEMKEGTNKIDSGVMQSVGQGEIAKAGKIYIGSWFMFLGAGVFTKAFAGIEGDMYKLTENKKEGSK